MRLLSKRFAPDAWLVYGATVKHLDLYRWWQRPRRYVLLSAGREYNDRRHSHARGDATDRGLAPRSNVRGLCCGSRFTLLARLTSSLALLKAAIRFT
jgi:hypothetical protein